MHNYRFPFLFAEEDHEKIFIISVVGGTLAVLIIMSITVFYIYHRRRHHRYQQMKDIQWPYSLYTVQNAEIVLLIYLYVKCITSCADKLQNVFVLFYTITEISNTFTCTMSQYKELGHTKHTDSSTYNATMTKVIYLLMFHN